MGIAGFAGQYLEQRRRIGLGAGVGEWGEEGQQRGILIGRYTLARQAAAVQDTTKKYFRNSSATYSSYDFLI